MTSSAHLSVVPDVKPPSATVVARAADLLERGAVERYTQPMTAYRIETSTQIYRVLVFYADETRSKITDVECPCRAIGVCHHVLAALTLESSENPAITAEGA